MCPMMQTKKHFYVLKMSKKENASAKQKKDSFLRLKASKKKAACLFLCFLKGFLCV